MTAGDSNGIEATGWSHTPWESCLHVLRIANPLYDSFPHITFQGSTDAAWLLWSQTILREILYPALQNGIQLAAGGQFQELLNLDNQISDFLLDSSRKASWASGRTLLLSLTVPRGERMLEKLARWSKEGNHCHFVLAYAARCAAFHFSPALCTASYICQEAWAGFPSSTAPLTLYEYVASALREGQLEKQSLNLRVA